MEFDLYKIDPRWIIVPSSMSRVLILVLATYNFSVVAVIEAGEVVARSKESAVLNDIGTTAIIIIGMT